MQKRIHISYTPNCAWPRAIFAVLACFLSVGAAEAVDWGPVKQLNDEIRASLKGPRTSYAIWLRTPRELWVYDNRTELGIGSHGLSGQEIALARDLGIRLIRHPMYWDKMERTETPRRYDEAYLASWDELIRRIRTEGAANPLGPLELLVVVHGNPPGVGWATRKQSYQRFAGFMGDMAKRYPEVRFWELWNEMDSAFTDLFGAGVQPTVPLFERGKHYAGMLKLAYPAIKAANPKSLVLIGGMTDWQEFPRGIYEGGGRLFFDIMNLHTYGVPVEWSVVIRGAELRKMMAQYGDRTRPLWNTELGIDAGNLVQAWGFPHDRGEKDGPVFDRMHLEQWRISLEAAWETGLYCKVLPYQLAAGNEAMKDKLGNPAYAAKYLPPGLTIDDYGFGLVRADGKTPRPTYEWLRQARLNRPLITQPSYRTDVEVRPAPDGDPEGYAFVRSGGKLLVKNVPVDRYVPTRIRLVGHKDR